MHRLAIAAASLIAATALIGGCEQEPFQETHLTLHALCESGDATPERIQAFLDLGNDVNATREMDLVTLELTKDEDRDGAADHLRGAMTPLQLAAMTCNLEAVEFLIKAGADSSLNAYGKRSPLQLAAGNNDDARVTAILIRAGSDVNARNWSDRTPLHAAGRNENPEVVTTLIKAGADLNAKDRWGATPLHLAAQYLHIPEVAITLIKAGADVNAKDVGGWTPLHAAGRNENPEVVTTLIKAGADLNAKPVFGRTPLHIAAGRNENPEVVSTLIEAGAHVNAKDVFGRTPLDSAEEYLTKNAQVIRAAGGKRGEDLPSPADPTTAATPLAKTGWGEIPTQVNPFYFTDFDSWVGKPLADQELARLINRPIPEALKTGRGFIMFFRSDCEHCHHMLEKWFTESVPAPTVAVLVDDSDPANAMPFPSTIVERKALPRGPNYVIATPALFAVKDGVVTGFASDPDDAASVETCIASNEN